MAGGHQPTVSVVVPVYNQAPVLERTVPSVLTQEAVSECIWVDDGSTDGSGERVEALIEGHANARIIRHPRNRGRSAARNTGLAAATGEVILFLDADIIAGTGVVRAHAARYGHTGVLGVLSRDEPLGLDPSRPFHRYLQTSTGPRDHPRDFPLPLKYCIIGYTSIRAEALRTVGGFDESITYGEDLDLAFRLLKQGEGSFYVEPTAVVHQLDRGDLDLRLAKLRAFGANLRMLERKHPELLRAAGLSFVASHVWRVATAPAPLVGRSVDRMPPFLQTRIIRYLLASAVVKGYAS